MRRGLSLARLGLALALGVAAPVSGCGVRAVAVRPTDFPFHATGHPLVDLHWRLEPGAARVRATGLVEASRADGLAEVLVELLGRDAEGRVVSRGLGRTWGGPLPRWGTRPFAVGLRPVGTEVDFELRVWSYAWESTPDRGARGTGR